MRKSLLFLLNTLLAAATLCVVSCGIDDVDAEDGAIQFELYDTEGTLIEGLQSMKFGATTAYTLKSAFVTYTEVTAPAGWKCSVIPSSRSCTVTAPVASDLEAEAGGDITIAITSQAGRTMSYTLSVAALEESISLTFDGDATTKNHIFSYGKSLVFPFSCENTSSLKVEAPEGWTTETDLENNQLTVTAPMPDSQNPTLTGAVKVTPLSVRGTAGESSSISVELSTKMPVIQFAEPIDRFVFGEQRDIPCTMQYVDKCDITAPEGWTVELDIAASMLKVTAPAEGVGIPAGTVTLDAVSAEELTESFETQLSLKGIATGDDFVAFGKAVTEAAPLDEFMQEGTVILLQDVDLSAFSQTCFVGQAENPFTGIFDGKGHTLTVSLNDGDAKELGLFHTLDATAAVKNLTLAGSMTISKIDPVTAGTLAVFNNGAALTGVTNTAAITFSGLKTSSTMGNLGGLVGQDKAGSIYTDCHNTGNFEFLQSVRSVAIGGLVGSAADDTVGSFVDCSNKGKINMNLADSGQDSGRIGGIIGMTEAAEWSYTNCVNEGAMTLDFNGTNKQFHSLGGILGYGYGSFEKCYNRGQIVMNNAKSANRRIGGIAGCIGSDKGKDKLSLKMVDCHNEADIAVTTNYTGGLVGIAEKMKSGLIENCTNTGNLSNPKTDETAAGSVPSQIGGIIGSAYGNLQIKGCINRGSITGVFRYRAAGILSAARNAGNSIESCENYGNITVTTIEPATTAFPLVAGLVVIENSNTVVTISTSKNVGTLTATVKSADHIKPVYIYQKAVESPDKPEADVTICDQATKDASAGTVMNITIKE